MNATTRNKRFFSAFKKKRAVYAVLKRGKSVSSVSRDLGIARKTLYSWIRIYKETPLRNKRYAFETKYVSGKNHPRSLKEKTRHSLIRLIVKYPNWGCRKYSSELKKKGINLGYFGVNSLLNKLKVETPDLRENFARNYSGPGRLQTDVKLEVIRKAVEEKVSVYNLSREYKVARKTIYKWIANYKKAQKKGIDGALALKENYVTGKNHPKAVYPQIQDKVLGIVRENPNLSVHHISKLVPVSNFTVWKILNNKNLNLFSQRLAYSQAQRQAQAPKPVPTGFLDRIRLVWEQFIPSLAPAPPPKFTKLLRTFVFASVSTFIVSFGTLSWFRILGSAQTAGQTIGLFFATLALFMGSLFFIYSLKYYITLAIVLSFSQQDPTTSATTRGKRKSFLFWLLGIGEEEEPSTNKGEKSKAIGLEPNLEHIILKRKPYVSVHIPFFNEKYVVERSIKAATNFDYQGDYEVILCDDSTDETSDIIKNYQKSFGKLRTSRGDGYTLTECEVRPGVTLKHLHRTTRSGYKGGALKKALTLTDPKAEFVSVFDADFVPYPDTLELFLKYFQATAGSLDFRSKMLDVRNNTDRNNLRSIDLGSSISNIAAVQGYQWHVLNKSENWITRGVRSEYAGSYVIERSGEEIYGGLKQISGAVYMIRRDVLQKVGWETSITEDFQLTLKLYERGYKVVYTPYIQAPAECVSTIKRLVRQRMRWAEGHSNNIRRMFLRLILNPELTLSEKLEFLYLTPYYLQALFFLVGTLSWLISETLFPARLPFWTSLWGWSLVLTNILALPLMNAVGLFLEESEERDYQGLLSFVALTYIVVPFQAYAALKGFLQREEGPWFRTPKTGRITDVFARGRFYRFITGILPRRSQPAVAQSIESRVQAFGSEAAQARRGLGFSLLNPNFSFSIHPRRKRWLSKATLAGLLIVVLLLNHLSFFSPSVVQAAHGPHIEQQINIIDQQATIAWYDTDWDYRKKITIDHTKVTNVSDPSTTYADFPVMIYLTGLSNIKADGADIRFTSSNGTAELPREIESYSSGTLWAWVKFTLTKDSSDSTDDELYMYYGNSAATEPAADSTYGSENVWDSNYVMVQHLDESPDNGVAGHIDSTSNTNNGTPTGFAGTAGSTTAATGKIDGADEFDGSDDDISVPDHTTLDITSAITLEAWIETDDNTQTNQYFLNKDTGDDVDPSWRRVYDLALQGDDIDFGLFDGTNFFSKTASSVIVSSDTPYHVVGVYDGTDMKIYVNGAAQGSPLTGPSSITTSADPLYIGSRFNWVSFFNGHLDEVRISNSARGAEWIATEYSNQNSPSTFLTEGNEEPLSGFNPTDNSLGIFEFDPAKYNGETVYFEVVRSFNGTTWTRSRSAAVTMPATAKNFTARIRVGDDASQVPGAQLYNVSDGSSTSTVTFGAATDTTVYLNAARLIVVQSDAAAITDTQTQIEVGNNEPITNTSNTQLTDKKIYRYDTSEFSGTEAHYFEASLKSGTDEIDIEQQINIIDQEYSTTGTDQPGNNSLGLVEFDPADFNGETVYFEGVIRCNSCTGGNTEVDAELVDDTGTVVTTVSTTSSTYTRVRSSAITPAVDDYTVQITRDATAGTAFIQVARIIVVQTDFSITATQTQVEVGNNETTTSTSATALTNPKYYQFDKGQFDATVNSYFEATLRSFGSSGNTVTYYFNGYDTGTAWTTTPEKMVDGLTTSGNFAVTAGSDETQRNDANNCDASCAARTDNITKVELRVHACNDSGDNGDISLTPIFSGGNGDAHTWTAVPAGASCEADFADWSPYYDITSDTNAEDWAGWDDIQNLDVDVLGDRQGGVDIIHASKVDIRVTYDTIGTATAQLYNRTDSAVVGNSSVTVASSSWARSRGASALSTNWDLTSDDVYEVRIYTSDASITTYLANAKIVIEQTGTITALETVQQYNNTLATDTDATYTAQNFDNEFNKVNFTKGTYKAYFEATVKTNNGSNAYFARLDTPLGEVTASDTSYTRKRNATDLWSSLPASATNIDVELKNASTSTTSSASSWLIIQASGLDGAATVYASLYTDASTCTTQMSGSEVSLTSTSWTRVRSSAISGGLTDTTDFMVCVRTTAGTAQIANAKIVIEQTQAPGITDMELVHQYINTNTSETATSLTVQDFDNRFDDDNLSAGTFTYYFEATMYCTTGCTATADLFDGTASITNSSITTTNETATRVRSGSALSGLPTAATDLDTRLQATTGDTTFSNTSWLIIQVSALQIPENLLLLIPLAIFLPKLLGKRFFFET